MFVSTPSAVNQVCWMKKPIIVRSICISKPITNTVNKSIRNWLIVFFNETKQNLYSLKLFVLAVKLLSTFAASSSNDFIFGLTEKLIKFCIFNQVDSIKMVSDASWSEMVLSVSFLLLQKSWHLSPSSVNNGSFNKTVKVPSNLGTVICTSKLTIDTLLCLHFWLKRV